MSKPTGVFFCPSCQSLVQSDGPLKHGVICGECDYEFGKPIPVEAEVAGVSRTALPEKSSGVSRDIMTKRPAGLAKDMDLEKIAIPTKRPEEVEEAEVSLSESGNEETILSDGSRRIRRRKKRPKKENHKNLIIAMAGTLLLMILAFALFKNRDDGAEFTSESKKEELSDLTVKREVLKRFYPEVVRNFGKFLSYPTNDGREQFISNSAELSLSYTRHYRQHAFPSVESDIKPVARNVIKLSDRDFGIETVWEDEDANKIGAVYLWDGEGWKVDWENFSRYSTDLWSRFRSELGAKEGTFRLLVRKQETSDERDEFNLSFYRPPLFSEDADAFRVTEYSGVTLETRSELGQEFLKLWNDFKAGEVPYDSILGASLDPENCLRITVVLAWEKNQMNESVIVLKDIVGVAWYGQVIQEFYEDDSPGDAVESELDLAE